MNAEQQAESTAKTAHIELARALQIDPLMTVAEVATLSRHPLSDIYREISELRLPAVRHGRSIRLKATDVREWMDTSE